MNDEELTIMSNLITEVQDLRKESKENYRGMMDARTECENVKRELSMLKVDAKNWSDEHKRRLELRSQLNELLSTLNMLSFDVDKLKQPRVFLRDFKTAVVKCIKDNGIAIRNTEDEA